MAIHAFIADARLHVRSEDGAEREILSPFATRKAEEADRMAAQRTWRNGGSADADPQAALIWGRRAAQPAPSPFVFRNVIVADRDTLYYVLSNHSVAGLFRYDLATGDEQRLFHNTQFVEHGVDYSPSRRQFVLAVSGSDGRVNLELFEQDGRAAEIITDGDSCDAGPSFSAARPNSILFHSCGIARTEEGHPVALGPASIDRLDLETGELTELLSDEDHDYLMPREDAEGRLYCIRRPYAARKRHAHIHALRDAVLFPVRLLSALVGFLTAFTRLFEMNAKRAGGPTLETAGQAKYVQVLGETIDLARIGKRRRMKGDPSLVPGTWELIRKDPDGRTATLARNVSAYDLDRAGTVICTNGYRVDRIENGAPELVFRHRVIEVVRSAE